MKKIFALLMLVVIFMTAATAFAATPCNLCGREHALTADGKCPEACSNVGHGNSHKYYECPDFDGYCSTCGKFVGDHTANTCPKSDQSWLDDSGVWKVDKYLKSHHVARKATYCGYCGYYGYHSEAECLNNPSADKNDCEHKSCVSQLLDEQKEWQNSKEICYVLKQTYALVCECGAQSDPYTVTQKVAHEWEWNTCKACGYNRSPKPTATPKPTSTPSPTEVPHTHTYKVNVIGYEYSQYCYTDEICRNKTYTYQDMCECGAGNNPYKETYIVKHQYDSNHVCTQCGHMESTYMTPTIAPTVEPTQAPTVEPTQASTVEPTPVPTVEPTPVPTAEPTQVQIIVPTATPVAQLQAITTVVPHWTSYVTCGCAILCVFILLIKKK